MDRYTELEKKFAADKLTLSEMKSFIGTNALKDYYVVVGLDTFYSGNGRVLRYRRPLMGSDRSELTYKQRKRNGDITDRTEINLRLESDVGPEDVEAFVTAMGLTEHFSLRKESHIFHVQDGDAHVVVALYDVMGPDGIKRFLEVEIENTSEIEDEAAAGILTMWVNELQGKLGLVEPLNTSLYELFAPRDGLFLPETF